MLKIDGRGGLLPLKIASACITDRLPTPISLAICDSLRWSYLPDFRADAATEIAVSIGELYQRSKPR